MIQVNARSQSLDILAFNAYMVKTVNQFGVFASPANYSLLITIDSHKV